MRRYLIALAISQIAAPSWAQQATLSAQAQTALDHYLKVECTVGETRQTLTELLQFKPEIESTLIGILRNGPDKNTLEKYRRVREDQWTRRESFLKRHPPRDLSQEDVKILGGMTKESYVKGGLARLRRTYRNKAAVALVEIRSADARKALKEVSANDEALLTVIRGAEVAHEGLHGTLDGPILAPMAPNLTVK